MESPAKIMSCIGIGFIIIADKEDYSRMRGHVKDAILLGSVMKDRV